MPDSFIIYKPLFRHSVKTAKGFKAEAKPSAGRFLFFSGSFLPFRLGVVQPRYVIVSVYLYIRAGIA